MRVIFILITLINIPFSAYEALLTTIIQSCYEGDTFTAITTRAIIKINKKTKNLHC